MTFEAAFNAHPYDVEAIAKATGMEPCEVDRLINQLMDARYAEKAREARLAQQRAWYIRARDERREIRGRHA